MKRIYYFIFIILLSGCTSKAVHSITEDREYLLQQTKHPLSIELFDLDLQEENDNFILSFNVTNVEKHDISPSDYTFQWPTYVFDNDGTLFHLQNTEIEVSEEHGNNQYVIKVLFDPLPTSETEYITVPFLITPTLYKKGYPFFISGEELNIDNQLTTADIHIKDLEINSHILRFTLEDEHPSRDRRNISYQYTIKRGKDDIHPLFTRSEQGNRATTVELEFADPIPDPVQLQIHRTTVPLPEWRLSFQVPVK